MKKSFLTFITVLFVVISTNVFAACGDITQISTDTGTIKKSGNKFTIYIPVGVKSVNISASATGDWVKGYGPRTLLTSNVTKLMVDGTSCGGETITYPVYFEQTDQVVAVNETTTNSQKTTTNVQSQSSEESTEAKPSTASTKNEIFLSSLKVEDYDIEFDKEVDTYYIKVKNEVERIDIEAVAEDTTAKIDISDNAKALEEGENKVIINLVNKDNKKGQYIIIVTREKELDNNAFLADIKIDNYLLTFDRDTTEYNLAIKSEKALNIIATPESKYAKVNIKGNSDLTDGSVITITVKAEDGTKRDYVINISKEFNIFDYWIYPTIGGLVFLLLILLIVRRKRRKRKKAKNIPSADIVAPKEEVKNENDKLDANNKKEGNDNEVFKL